MYLTCKLIFSLLGSDTSVNVRFKGYTLLNVIILVKYQCTNLGISLRENVDAHSIDFEFATAGLGHFYTAAMEAKMGGIMPEQD